MNITGGTCKGAKSQPWSFPLAGTCVSGEETWLSHGLLWGVAKIHCEPSAGASWGCTWLFVHERLSITGVKLSVKCQGEATPGSWVYHHGFLKDFPPSSSLLCSRVSNEKRGRRRRRGRSRRGGVVIWVIVLLDVTGYRLNIQV